MNPIGRDNKFYTHTEPERDVFKVLRVVTTCILVEGGGHQRFGGNCCLLLQCNVTVTTGEEACFLCYWSSIRKQCQAVHLNVNSEIAEYPRTGTIKCFRHFRDIAKTIACSVRPHGITQLPLDGFLWNLVFEYFSGPLHEDLFKFMKISR